MLDKKLELNFMIPLFIALSSAGFFALMFLLMGYFELMGSDVTYFDQGTENNIKMINSFLGVLGFKLNPEANLEVSTKGYALCYGLSMIVAGTAIIIANRRARDEYEVTDAKK